jgi:hypothetical protein
VLERLGPPEAIAGAAADRPPPPLSIHQGPVTPESVALIMLVLSPIAGLVEIIVPQGGWLLVVGIAATNVIRSAMWSRREKILGLTVIPLAMPALLLSAWWLVEPVRALDGVLLGTASALGAGYLRDRVNERIAAVAAKRSQV